MTLLLAGTVTQKSHAVMRALRQHGDVQVPREMRALGNYWRRIFELLKSRILFEDFSWTVYVSL